MITEIEKINEEVIKCKTCNHYSGMHANWQEECWEDNCECKWYKEK